MRNKQFILTAILLASGIFCKAQDNEVVLKYISTYKEAAIAEMQRSGVPASITLAQGIHETMAGTSDLVIASNNHFGIKCKSGWTGESVYHDDDLKGECFRKYESPLDSYRDHSDFLKGAPRYAGLFTLDPLDYKGWAYGLKKAGYATNPKYPVIIIKLIEDYELQDYCLIAQGKMSRGEDRVAKIMLEKNIQSNEAILPAATPAVEKNTEEAIAEEKVDYPSGEFRINDTRVIYASKGTPVLSIAQQYRVPLARIFEFNDMAEKETLEKDQLIYLQRKRKVGNNEFHIVKSGETMKDIARIEAIRLESLLEYNHLEANARPATGEQIYLHRKAPGVPRLETRMTANTNTVE